MPWGGENHRIRTVNARGRSVAGQKTHAPWLKATLLHYLRGRGTITCLECLVDLNLPHILQEFTELQDVIGWDSFVMGMVSTKLLPIQSAFSYSSRSSSNAMRWISGLITQLLQVTHTQWLYWCMLVHDCTADTIISAHKEEYSRKSSISSPSTQKVSTRRMGSCWNEILTS